MHTFLYLSPVNLFNLSIRITLPALSFFEKRTLFLRKKQSFLYSFGKKTCATLKALPPDLPVKTCRDHEQFNKGAIQTNAASPLVAADRRNRPIPGDAGLPISKRLCI